MKCKALLVSSSEGSKVIGGLTTLERVRRSCEKCKIPIISTHDLDNHSIGFSDCYLVLNPEYVFDLELYENLIQSLDDSFVYVYGTSPRSIGMAKVQADRLTEFVRWDTKQMYVDWNLMENMLPHCSLESLEHYSKEMRKMVCPVFFDPKVCFIKNIEQHLLQTASKGTNDWVAMYLHPWPQNIMTRSLWRFSFVTPNMVSIANIGISLGALYGFISGGFMIGTILANLYGIVDGIDGKLARTKIQFSTKGYYLDHVSDQISESLWFIFMGIGLYKYSALGFYSWIFTGLLILFYFLDRITTGLFATKNNVQMHDYRKFDRFIRIYGARRNNDYLLLAMGAGIGQFSVVFVITVFYTIITTLIKMFRFFWISRCSLQSDQKFF